MSQVQNIRNYLGEKAENMTDEEVMSVETRMRIFAGAMVDKIWGMTPEERKVIAEKYKMEHPDISDIS